MKNAEDLSPVKAGDVVSERYRIDRVIGIGGMAVVVSATDLRLGNVVALKFLLPQALLHEEIVTRFDREARAAVRVKSEHVARVMDVGHLDSGAPYMVMEYLDGRDLSSELEAKGSLPVFEVVDYVLQACEAVAEAHRLGLVHRDLKPANLFLVDGHGTPTVKVLDFGISKMSSLVGATGFDAGITQSASALGSPLYMSPEQMDSPRDVDARTDIWALGVVLYELLAGAPPFIGESIPQLCIAILQHTPASLRARRPDVPARFEAVILRCLEKDPARRFRNVEELAMALAEFAPPRSRLSLDRINSVRATAADRGSNLGRETVAAEDLTGFVPSDSNRVWTGRGRRRAPPTRQEGSTHAGWGGTAAGKRDNYRRWAWVGLPLAALVGASLFFGFRRSVSLEKKDANGASTPSVSAGPPVTNPAGKASARGGDFDEPEIRVVPTDPSTREEPSARPPPNPQTSPLSPSRLHPKSTVPANLPPVPASRIDPKDHGGTAHRVEGWENER